MADSRRSGEKILVLDRGNLELALPRDWSVKADPGGFLKAEDPTEECLLEISYMQLPPLTEHAPKVDERLRFTFTSTSDGTDADITTVDRGDLRLAWSDYPYEAEDPATGRRRPARGRRLLAENGRFQALLCFYYWPGDASWTLPAWERIVATLRLGFGERLRSPFEHWSLRDRD